MLATFFLLPAIAWPAALILSRELAIWLGWHAKDSSSYAHRSIAGNISGNAVGAAFAILLHSVFGMLLAGCPTFANVNALWQYAPNEAGFEPIHYWKLLFAGAAGGVFAALALLAYDRFRTRSS